MKKDDRIQRTIVKVFLLVLIWFTGLIAVKAQTSKLDSKPLDFPNTPISCEEWINYINDATRRWSKNKDTSFIVIARLGDREILRRTTQKRIKTLRDYILDNEFKKKIVFAEGERVQNFGTIEFYVEGRLLYSLPVLKNEDIPLKFCKP